jgi:hypothetical protein
LLYKILVSYGHGELSRTFEMYDWLDRRPKTHRALIRLLRKRLLDGPSKCVRILKVYPVRGEASKRIMAG